MREFSVKMPQGKTRGRALCEPAQSKCTWTKHKNPFYARIYSSNPASQDRDKRFVRASAVEMHMDMSQGIFMIEFTGKMPQTKTTAHTWCEPAQSKLDKTQEPI